MFNLFKRGKPDESPIPQPKKKDTIVSFSFALKSVSMRNQLTQCSNVAVMPEVGDWVLFEKVEKQTFKPGINESVVVASFRARCTAVTMFGWGEFETWKSEIPEKVTIHYGELFDHLYLRKIIPVP